MRQIACKVCAGGLPDNSKRNQDCCRTSDQKIVFLSIPSFLLQEESNHSRNKSPSLYMGSQELSGKIPVSIDAAHLCIPLRPPQSKP